MAETIQKKQVCKCENCGNEAEMVVTCSLPEEAHEHKEATPPEADRANVEEEKNRVKGTATCSTCGNEADMWIDI